jgi:hypothetical protein
VIENDSGPEDPDTAWHLEALYRYPINDYLMLNPGFILILNPEHNASNDPIAVGTLRFLYLIFSNVSC